MQRAPVGRSHGRLPDGGSLRLSGYCPSKQPRQQPVKTQPRRARGCLRCPRVRGGGGWSCPCDLQPWHPPARHSPTGLSAPAPRHVLHNILLITTHTHTHTSHIPHTPTITETTHSTHTLQSRLKYQQRGVKSRPGLQKPEDQLVNSLISQSPERGHGQSGSMGREGSGQAQGTPGPCHPQQSPRVL